MMDEIWSTIDFAPGVIDYIDTYKKEDKLKELNTYRLEQKDITDLLPKEKVYLI